MCEITEDEDFLAIYRRADDPEVGCYVLTPLLMDGRALSGRQQAYVEGLDVVIDAEQSLTTQITVYRGCSHDCIGAVASGQAYLGFLSTSTSRAEALQFAIRENGVLLKIHLSEGVKVVSVSANKAGLVTLESGELLLGRGHRFKVLGVVEPDAIDDNAISLADLGFASGVEEYEVELIFDR